MQFEARRILAVKLSSFGDIVHVTGALRALRESYPKAEILLAVESRWADVVRNNPHLDGSLVSSAETRLTPAYLLEIRRKLAIAQRHAGFDLAIDFQGTRRSAAWVYLSGARVMTGRGRLRPGWKSPVIPDLTQHAVRVCAAVCERIGVPVSRPDPELFPDPAEESVVDAVLDRVGAGRSGFALLNPFSRWDSKSWSVANSAALAREIARECRLPVVVTGGPEERAKAAELVELTRGAAVSVAGDLTLAQALCLYRRGSFLITCDSGPMLAAAALGVPVVALFGPTHPERTGPWGAGHRVLQAARPPEHHAYRNDPEGRYMAALRVEPVLEAALEVAGLAGAARPA